MSTVGPVTSISSANSYISSLSSTSAVSLGSGGGVLYSSGGGSSSDDSGAAVPSLQFSAEQRALWASKTVEELHAVESKLRFDADEKREELRQLVGLKYRDLIQSADSIVSMRDIAFDALNKLQNVGDILNSLLTKNAKGAWADDAGARVGSSAASADDAATAVVAAFYESARAVSQSPELIWTRLAEHRCLDAARVYCYAVNAFAQATAPAAHAALRAATRRLAASTARTAAAQAPAAAADKADRKHTPASAPPAAGGKAVTATGTAGNATTNATTNASDSKADDATVAAAVSRADSALDQTLVYLYQQRVTLAQLPAAVVTHAQRRLLTRTDRVSAATAPSAAATATAGPTQQQTQQQLTAADYADALAAIAVLGSAVPRAGASTTAAGPTTPQQLLALFLNSRSAWLTRVLAAARTALERFRGARGADPTATASHALASVTRTLQCTIAHVALLFGTPSGSSAGAVALASASGSASTAASDASVSALLQRFKSGMTSAGVPVPPLDDTRLLSFAVRQQCTGWLRIVTARTNAAIGAILSHCITGQHVSAVRDAVLQALCFVDEFPAAAATASADATATRPPKSTAAGPGRIGAVVPTADGKARDEPAAVPSLSARQRRAAIDALTARWNEQCVAVVGQALDLWTVVFREPFGVRIRALVAADADALTALHSNVERALTKWFPAAKPAEPAAAPETKEADADITGIVASTGRAGHRRVASSALTTGGAAGAATKDVSAAESAGADTPARSSLAAAVALTTSPQAAAALTLELNGIIADFEQQLTRMHADFTALLRSRHVAGTGAEAGKAPARAIAPVERGHARTPSLGLTDAKRSGGDDESGWDVFALPSVAAGLTDEVAPAVRGEVTAKLTKAFASLRAHLTRLQTQSMDAAAPAVAIRLVDQAVFIGRVCKRLLQSPALKRLVALAPSQAPALATAAASGTNYAESLLLDTAAFAFRIWSVFVASTLGDEFRRSISAWLRQWAADPSLATTWQRVAEAADGDATASAAPALSLPSHASAHVMSFAFEVTHELYRVNGSDVDAQVLGWLVTDVSAALLAIHESELSAYAAAQQRQQHSQQQHSQQQHPLCQPAAIQFAFDTQFLFALLKLPGEGAAASSAGAAAAAGASLLDDPETAGLSYAQRLRKLLSRAEACVDVIDWHHCRAPLHSRLQRLLARCGVLFGTLLQLSGPAVGAADPLAAGVSVADAKANARGAKAGAGAGESEAANILPLAAASSRVPPFRTALYPTKRFQLHAAAGLASPAAPKR